MYITGAGRKRYSFKFVPGPSIHKKRLCDSCIMAKYIILFCKEKGRLIGFIIKAKVLKWCLMVIKIKL